jgi:hypothetical protein
MLCLQSRQQKREAAESWQKSDERKRFLLIQREKKGIQSQPFWRDRLTTGDN